MSRYPLEYSAQHHAPPSHAGNAGPFHASLQPNGHDERGSQSPSDDGSTYVTYTKTEAELEEESNASLITQTLNTDGTPKRPMNAFMIFARRRRPQVSAENQSMRTGEISKILSKEWNAMELVDKQFYLDQAKQLKETFNSKYPDYVYRRRPNNSRRKRGTAAGGMKVLDHLSSTDTGGDDSGNPEFDDISPIDGDDLLAPTPDLRYPRLSPAGITSSYDNPSHPRSSSYGYSAPDASYRQSHGRGPYPSGQHRGTPDISLESPRVSQTVGSGHHYPQYPQTQQPHAHSPTLYASEHGSWDPTSGVSRTEHARTVPPSWISGQDRVLPSLGSDRSRTYPPPSGQMAWGRTTPPDPPRSAGASPPGYPFPTLNSPFYPHTTSQHHGNYPASGGSSHSNSATYQMSPHDAPGPIQRSSSGQDHRSYAPSPPPPNSYPSLPNRDPAMYHQHSQHLPLLQASLPNSATSSSTGSSNDTSYWSRDHHGQ